MPAVDIEDWYRKYGPMVQRRCRQILVSPELAEEAMQDVFISVLREAPRLEERAPSSYLYRAATNTCLNILRSRGRRPEAASTDLVERIALATTTESDLAARQTLDRLFRRQKEGTAYIAMLHFVDGMTLEEVAHEVGMSVSGVRKRLQEVKSRLSR
jgi:RNA polymerase sigma-70 factor, ECF subfamily